MNRRIIAVLIVSAAGVSALTTEIILNKKLEERDERAKKVHELYKSFDRWLQIHQEGKSLIEYFQQHNYKSIAIYGMKELGERLYDELNGSGITVSFVIDKNADEIYADVDVVTPDDRLESVDVVVVTAITFYDEIEKMLSKKISCPIISLKDILYEL